MPKKSALQDRALEWIERLPVGATFRNDDVYAHLTQTFPAECRDRGDAATEPRFQNDARWAVQKAKASRIVKDTGISGQHQRLATR